MTDASDMRDAERLDHFMARANGVYYATHDPFADFATAPEISQIFGEILGAWAAVVIASLGDTVRIVEAGPGRGTLMADVLRTLSRVRPRGLEGLSLHLIETSPRLRAAQAAALQRFPIVPIWHDDLAGVPEGPMLLLANEFLDALPIRQFVRTDIGWDEQYVHGGTWLRGPAHDMPAVLSLRAAMTDETVEICPAAIEFVSAVATRLTRCPGVAMFIDYGSARSLPGDSLQALRNGRPVNPLEQPGEADLTAHVDFEAMAQAARRAGAVPCGPVEQGRLLVSLGAVERCAVLCRSAPDQAQSLRSGLDRLLAPERMGRLFKALAVTSEEVPVPPGFSRDESHTLCPDQESFS